MLVSLAGTAGAQLQATFYHLPGDFHDTPPDLTASFSGTPYCTTTLGSSTTGFSFDFTAAATQSMLAGLCGVSASNFQRNFAVLFTGSLVAPSPGTYSINLNSDDGNVVTMNGQVFNNWGVQGGGPGTISALLTGGSNPFTIQYFENDYGGAFIDFTLGNGLSVTPPSSMTTTPEPSSFALLGTGLVGLVPMVRRRLRK